MPRVKNLTGRKFGRLTVIKEEGRAKDRHVLWFCKCDCGNTCLVPSNVLKKGDTRSCGCLFEETQHIPKHIKHGESNTRLYQIWIDMRDRCRNKNNKRYYSYGGRGITVCEEWRDNFQAFHDWAMANGYREDLTIDRENVNGNYEPSNCRWKTRKEQNNNTTRSRYITYQGKTQTIAQWAEELNMPYNSLTSRLQSGWTVERALTEPTHKKKPSKK